MTNIVYAFNNKFTCQVLLDRKKANLLVSYYYLIRETKFTDWLELIRQARQDVEGMFMLDSGAFSAWNNGGIVNLYDYIDFIKEYHKYFTHVVCLDVIDNPIYSEINHLIMLEELKNYNLTIIPVFHSGEPFSVLDYMVEKGYQYLGVSPNNNWSENSKRSWLTKVFERYNFDELGIETHGFGYQSLEGLSRFKLTSADSNSWAMAAGYGGIVTPQGMFLCSEQTVGKASYLDIEMVDFKFVTSLCLQLGIELDELKTDYVKRFIFNIEAIEVLANRGKKEISSFVDLFSDERQFNIYDIFELYALSIAQGRGYTGSPPIENNRHKKAKKVKIEKRDTLF